MSVNIKYKQYCLECDIPYINGKIYDFSKGEENFLRFNLNFQMGSWSLFIGRIGKKWKTKKIPEEVNNNIGSMFPVTIMTWMSFNFEQLISE
ncbi:MAG: hypothetical protein ACOCV1_08085, partial [Bacillota bacterium]